MNTLRRMIGLVLLALVVTVQSMATVSAATLSRCKLATALVETAHGTGTAFCIGQDGYFLTNQHVIAKADGAITLVLQAGEAGQQTFPASVVRADEDADLALLHITANHPVPCIPLGDTTGLTETMEVTALGFPLGKGLALNHQQYPSISVNTGHVTALRHDRGKLVAIQLDATLNPGNSGGPVVNDSGEVIGIVNAGIVRTGINFAIPIDAYKTFISKPDAVTVSPQSLPLAGLKQEIEFQITVTPFAKETTYKSVILHISAGQYILATPKGRNTFTARFTPVGKDRTISDKLTLRVFEGDNFTDYQADDRDIVVAAQQMRLADIISIRPNGSSSDIGLWSGEQVIGSCPWLQAAPVLKDGVKLTKDFSNVTRIDVTNPLRAFSAWSYTVYVTSQEGEEWRFPGTFSISGTSIALHNPGEPLTRPADIPAVAVTTTTPVAGVQQIAGGMANVPLPGVVTDIVQGGGGRYLVMQMASARKVAIFDATERRIVKEIAIESDDVHIAAGLHGFLLALGDQGVIQRWSFDTLEREKTVPAPGGVTITSIGMAANSDGPALLWGRGGAVSFLDVNTMRPLQIALNAKTIPPFANIFQSFGTDDVAINASADGSLFTLTPTTRNLYGEALLVFLNSDQSSASVSDELRCNGLPLPDETGQTIYTYEGPYPVSSRLSQTPPNGDSSTCYLPVLGAALYLKCQRTTPQHQDPAQAAVQVYSANDRRLLYSLPTSFCQLTVPVRHYYDMRPMSLNKRIFYLPQAGMLVTLPYSMSALQLTPFSLEQALSQSANDYFYVSSPLQLLATRGGTYQYQIDTKTNKPGITYSLECGPDGMTVSPQGVINWAVSTTHPGGQESVLVSMRNAGGQEIFLTFELTVR